MLKMLAICFNRGFLWSLPVTLLGGLFVPAMISAGAPAYDGQQVYGFPFAFYRTGGLRADSTIATYFSGSNLAFDVLILVAAAMVVGVLYGLWKPAT